MFQSAPTQISLTSCAAPHRHSTSPRCANVVIQRSSVSQIVGRCAETKAMWPSLFVDSRRAIHLPLSTTSTMFLSQRLRIAIAVSAGAVAAHPGRRRVGRRLGDALEGHGRLVDEGELEAALVVRLHLALHFLQQCVGVGPACCSGVPSRRCQTLSALAVGPRSPPTHRPPALCLPSGVRGGRTFRPASVLHLLCGVDRGLLRQRLRRAPPQRPRRPSWHASLVAVPEA